MTLRSKILAALAVLLLGGCGPKASKVTPNQRKEAAALVSEAQFALSVRDPVRAEGLLTKATALCPDTGDYWFELGQLRVRAGHRAKAKSAYQAALSAYEHDASANPQIYATAVLRQVYLLALLGRTDDARAVLTKAQKMRPDDREIRAFAENKQLDQLLASPGFKAVAL